MTPDEELGRALVAQAKHFKGLGGVEYVAIPQTLYDRLASYLLANDNNTMAQMDGTDVMLNHIRAEDLRPTNAEIDAHRFPDDT